MKILVSQLAFLIILGSKAYPIHGGVYRGSGEPSLISDFLNPSLSRNKGDVSYSSTLSVDATIPPLLKPFKVGLPICCALEEMNWA